jgi:hypothetical protein
MAHKYRIFCRILHPDGSIIEYVEHKNWMLLTIIERDFFNGLWGLMPPYPHCDTYRRPRGALPRRPQTGVNKILRESAYPELSNNPAKILGNHYRPNRKRPRPQRGQGWRKGGDNITDIVIAKNVKLLQSVY